MWSGVCEEGERGVVRSGWEGQGGGVGGLKWMGMRVCGSNVGKARMKKGRWEGEGSVDNRFGREM